MAIIFKLTSAGRQALVNAAQDGTQARRIVSVGVTATSFTPTATIATVPGEIKRINTIAGDVVASDTIHVTIRDDGNSAYAVRGLGLYLDNGVLLGTYSQAAVILEKSPASIFLLATDLRVLDGSIDISTLQFGETNFINPPATTERQGVVQLATQAMATALSDATRALTAASVKALFEARSLVGHIHDVATQAANGFMSAEDKKKLDGIAASANNYTLPAATAAALGGIKLGNATVQTVAAAAPTTTASRSYSVQVNSSGQAVVNVPWVDTDTVYTLPAATAAALGGIKLGNATVQTVAPATPTTTAGRSYAVQVNSSGQAVVNVPWVDTDTVYTLPAATAAALGGIKLGNATVQTVAPATPTTTAGRSYAVQVNSSGQAVVNVPWTNTTYSAATTSVAGLLSAADKTKLDGIATSANAYTLPAATAAALGGIKLGNATLQTVAAATPSTTDGRSYAVQVNSSGQAVVNVPWINTTYSTATASTSGIVELATNAEAQAGTDATRAVTPAALAAACMGTGQTWQDLTASRVVDTTYTNTTGKPIFVSVTARRASGNSAAALSLFVSSIKISRSVTRYESYEKAAVVSGIVPAGETYRIGEFEGDGIFIWAELR